MNKKGIITIIIVIVLVIIGYFVWGGKNSTPVNVPVSVVTVPVNNPTTPQAPSSEARSAFAPVTKDNTDASLLTKLGNASVDAAETGSRVALVNGQAQFSSGDVKGTLTLGNVAVETTVGSNKYALSSLAVNTGGSGTFKYVVLFDETSGTPVDTSYALIGDRVNITGLRSDTTTDANGNTQLVVTVSYLDHDKGEPLSSAPSVPHTKILVVENGAFNSAKELDL